MANENAILNSNDGIIEEFNLDELEEKLEIRMLWVK